jgi:hypothetical protein
MQTEPEISPQAEVRHASRSDNRLWLVGLLLLAAVLAAFGRSAFNDFVDWDDSKLIFDNPNISHPTLHGLARQWDPRDPDQLAMYNPLVYTVWWALAHSPHLPAQNILGTTMDPMPFHAANLLVHWLNACLVLQILMALGFSARFASVGALLFAVHSLQTEAVAWATGMKDLLGGFFSLGTILAYLRAVQSGEKRSRNYWIASALFIAALLSKPSAVVLPLIVAALDRILYRRRWKTIVAWTAPWLVPAIAAALIAQRIQSTADIESNPIWARPLIAADALAFYLWKLVVPIQLTFEYGRTPRAVFNDPQFMHPLYWTWIFPVIAGLIVWRLRRPLLSASAWIFVLALLPVLGFAPFVFQYHSTVADRYVYVSMLGIAIVTAVIASKFKARIAWGPIAFIMLVLTGLSFLQAGRWKNTETLYEYGRQFPAGTPLHLFVLGQIRDKQWDIARQQTNRHMEDKYLAQAIDDYQETLRMDALFGQAYRNLTVDLIHADRIDEAIEVTRKRMEVQPQLPAVVRDKPARLHAVLGSLYYRRARYAEALGEFELSMKLEPTPEVQQLLEQDRQKMESTRSSN